MGLFVKKRLALIIWKQSFFMNKNSLENLKPNNIVLSTKKEYENIPPDIKEKIEKELTENEIKRRIEFYKSTMESNYALKKDLELLNENELREFGIQDLVCDKYSTHHNESESEKRARKNLTKKIFGE